MRNRFVLATVIVVPLLLSACDRDEDFPVISGLEQESQMLAAGNFDQLIERLPTAAGNAVAIPYSTLSYSESLSEAIAERSFAAPSGEYPRNRGSEYLD